LCSVGRASGHSALPLFITILYQETSTGHTVFVTLKYNAELLKDKDGKRILHVALNVQNTALNAANLPRPITDAKRMGMWYNGKNCGRWIEITLKEDCLGLTLTPSDPPSICGVNPFYANPLAQKEYKNDTLSGKVMYAVVADSCQDGNFWYAAFITYFKALVYMWQNIWWLARSTARDVVAFTLPIKNQSRKSNCI
jgi:hypothetical protein